MLYQVDAGSFEFLNCIKPPFSRMPIPDEPEVPLKFRYRGVPLKTIEPFIQESPFTSNGKVGVTASLTPKRPALDCAVALAFIGAPTLPAGAVCVGPLQASAVSTLKTRPTPTP